ncbi:MAG TPA: RidA family protein [Chitinophagaceae bacterium]|nr:RidA family protein [Chitinophagaceae bacterium]
MTEIKKLSSGAKWEEIVGYSRAVIAGNRVIIGGTTAVDENSNLVGKGDAYAQTKYVFQKIEKYLKQAGSRLENVVINRIYVTDITKWEEIGRAHAEFFGKIKPCCMMIEVNGFIDPNMIVEIETEAIAD